MYRLSLNFGTIDVRSNAQLLSMTTQKIKLPHFLQKLHRSAHSDLYNHHLVETTTIQLLSVLPNQRSNTVMTTAGRLTEQMA